MNLFFWKTAVEIVQFCEENQITIWGFDSFQIKSDGIHPFQEYSPNYSAIEKHKPVVKLDSKSTRLFLKNINQMTAQNLEVFKSRNNNNLDGIYSI